MRPGMRPTAAREEPPRYYFRLGNRGLLLLFFAAAAVCGMSFSFGYTLGKHTIPATFSLANPPRAGQSASAPGTVSAASAPGVEPPDTAGLSAAEASQTAAGLDPTAPPPAAPADGNPAPAPTATGASTGASIPSPTVPPSPNPAPAVVPAAVSQPPQPAPTGGQSLMIRSFQNAADASALATYLRNTYHIDAIAVAPAPGQSAYQVRVGPFATDSAMEAVKSRLTGSGYSPVVVP